MADFVHTVLQPDDRPSEGVKQTNTDANRGAFLAALSPNMSHRIWISLTTKACSQSNKRQIVVTAGFDDAIGSANPHPRPASNVLKRSSEKGKTILPLSPTEKIWY
jgi:hypothetical protein